MRLIKQSFFEIIINYEVKDLQKVLMFQKLFGILIMCGLPNFMTQFFNFKLSFGKNCYVIINPPLRVFRLNLFKPIRIYKTV